MSLRPARKSNSSTPLPTDVNRSLPTRATLVALAALALLLGACGRTALGGICPEGYDVDGGVCQCLTDEGCPAGYVCESGTCECRSDGCCPAGYQFSLDSNACVCHDTACCPSQYVWNAAQQMCSCSSQACCPSGYVFDAVAQGCRCAADFCCPVGFGYDADAGAMDCVCQADSCCPVNYVFDATRNSCICGEDSCCPTDFSYNPSVRACICSGDSCCPAGFVQDSTAKRCVCTPAGCPANTECDATSGACKCLNDSGCPAGDFCNSAGSCQSSSSCTTNLDCPAGNFCNTNTNVCSAVAPGTCATDADCNYVQPNPVPGFGEVCQGGVCVAGCYTTADCPVQPAAPNVSKPSCVGANLGVSPPVLGSCQPFCLSNDSCPVNSFCDSGSGTCFLNAANLNCLDCSTCGSDPSYECLSFIVEGENTSNFCAGTCATDGDCPSAFSCGGVIHECPGGACDAPADGTVVQCLIFNPVNEPATPICAGPDGQPFVYSLACAPLSGFCPATDFP
jgi:hypothetical protein